MTSGPGADLHDPGALLAADTAGLLLAAATAGAQVRSVAEQLAGRSATDRPRAFVVVGASAATDVLLLSALIGDGAPAPVVAATSLPSWVGPLDSVVVLASEIADLAAAEAAATAERRGAALLVRAAAVGPVADAAGGALVEPMQSVTEALALPARLTLLLTAAARAGLCPAPDAAVAADLLDAMTLAYHPSSDFFVNPALMVADHLRGGTPLLIGTDPIGDALAAHGCRSLATLAGVAGSWLTAGQAGASPAVFARIAGAPDADVFHDPYDDDAGERINPVVLTGPAPAPTSRALAGALAATLRRALAVQDDGADEAADRAERRLAGRPSGEGAPIGGPGPDPGAEPVAPLSGAFTAALGLATRLDFAAVYLGLGAGSRPPQDAPSGLGRPDRVLHHVSPAGLRPGVGGPRPEPTEPASSSPERTEEEPGSWS